MEAVKMEKLRAMEKYRRSQFLHMLIQFVLRVVLLGLFMSSPNWVPSLCSCVKFFFAVCIPNMGAMITGPKFIFMVSNIIVVFLVGESRLSKSAAQTDVYDEYVTRSQSLQGASSVEVKENEEAIFVEPSLEENKDKDEKPEEEEGQVTKEGEEDKEKETEQGEVLQEEEDEGLPAEELNRRVEDFIAKFNMQRKIEARMLICYE
ncbi:hypothetical protein Cni_G21394 [Canna indica]|uniref:DUF4408 domain-containing protein n=1 Tax=Canna indica TaxID=4628 RepID=A0AAQ3KPF2_9LILI|nr:hypothetical protein Cni_G21394 [Canna indica]